MEEINQTTARNPYAPPTAPVADVAPTEAGEPRPATVSWAVVLLWLELAISVPGIFLPWQPWQSSAALVAWIAAAVICTLFALNAWLIYEISLGSPWARVFTAMILGPRIAALRLSIPKSRNETVLWAVCTALDVAALCLLFVSPVRRWFRRRRTVLQA